MAARMRHHFSSVAMAYETVVEIVDDPAFREWANGFLGHVLPRLPKQCLGHFIPQLKLALGNTQELNTRRVFIGILRAVDDPEWMSLIKTEMNRVLAMSGVSFRPNNHLPLSPAPKAEMPNAAPYIAEHLEAIYKEAPDWAADWLANQLTQGRFWWEPFTNYLNKMPDALLETVAAAALDTKLDVNTLQKRAVLLAGSDMPVVAKALLKEYLAFSPAENKLPSAPAYHQGNALHAGIRELPLAHLVDAVLAQAQITTDFVSLQKLFEILAHSAISQISKEQKKSLRSFVFRLEKIKPDTFNNEAGFQADIAMFLGAVGEADDAKIIEAWIEKERQRLAAVGPADERGDVNGSCSDNRTMDLGNGFGKPLSLGGTRWKIEDRRPKGFKIVVNRQLAGLRAGRLDLGLSLPGLGGLVGAHKVIARAIGGGSQDDGDILVWNADVEGNRPGAGKFGPVLLEHVANGPDPLIAFADAAMFADRGVVVVAGCNLRAARAVIQIGAAVEHVVIEDRFPLLKG